MGGPIREIQNDKDRLRGGRGASNRFGLVRFGSVWFGLVRFGSVRRRRRRRRLGRLIGLIGENAINIKNNQGFLQLFIVLL